MKKITIKLLSLMVVITLFFTMIGCSFLGLTVDEAKANLEEAGYTVTVMDGADYIDSEENQFTMLVSSELDKYLYAEKGDDHEKNRFYCNLHDTAPFPCILRL